MGTHSQGARIAGDEFRRERPVGTVSALFVRKNYHGTKRASLIKIFQRAFHGHAWSSSCGGIAQVRFL
jgi:hypothetical protein